MAEELMQRRTSIMRMLRHTAVVTAMIGVSTGVVSSCSEPQQLRASDPAVASDSLLSDDWRVLIVYLSRTGNTKAIAEFIRERVGGTIVQLELETPYPSDYSATVEQVARENESGYLPPLRTKIEGIEQYHVLFLGFPTWGMQLIGTRSPRN